jgi:hypothetical protein
MAFQRIKPVLLALLLSSSLAHAAGPAPRIGVQLWSVKDDLKQDFDGTLATLAGMGFEGVEFAGEFGRFAHDPAGRRALLDKRKLQCAGAHLDFAALTNDRFSQTTAFYQAVGCRKLIIAWDKRGASLEGAAAIARELAALSSKLQPLGMRIGYHNHAQEMAGPVGQAPWDAIASGTPHEAILQQDIGWTVFAGKDPVALIKRYPSAPTSRPSWPRGTRVSLSLARTAPTGQPFMPPHAGRAGRNGSWSSRKSTRTGCGRWRR